MECLSCIKRLFDTNTLYALAYGLGRLNEFRMKSARDSTEANSFFSIQFNIEHVIQSMLDVTRSKQSLDEKGKTHTTSTYYFWNEQLKARVVCSNFVSHISHFFGDMGLTENERNIPNSRRQCVYTFSHLPRRYANLKSYAFKQWAPKTIENRFSNVQKVL